MLVRLKSQKGWVELEAPNIDVARLVSAAYGFTVDVEPMGPGRCVVTAEGSGTRMSFSGTTVHDACHKLIESLTERYV